MKPPRQVALASEVADLLGLDPFRLTRTDADLARLERAARKSAERPYWHLLRALLGVVEPVAEARARGIWRDVVAHRRALGERVGRPFPLRAAAIDWLYLRDETERPIRTVVLSRAALARVVDEGRRDPLTGLPRKTYFERALASELKAVPFAGGCVVFIDLDGFKRANDELGHAAGDATLRRFARVATAALRKDDLVGRLGGDEFGLVLRGLPAKMARRIVVRLRTSFERQCVEERVSFSFGICALRPDDTPGAALARADAAMYRQKRRRKASASDAASLPRSDRRARRR